VSQGSIRTAVAEPAVVRVEMPGKIARHLADLDAAVALNAEGASSADRKAYRIYSDRLNNATMSAGIRLHGVECAAVG
jgi:hypothetical protein